MRPLGFIPFMLLLVLLVPSRSSAQLEVGLQIGATNYYGDLNGQDVLPSQTHIAGAILGRYNINPRWAVKGYFAYGRISGADSLSKSVSAKLRNLSFYSDIYEFSAQVELNLIKDDIGYRGRNRLIPYLYLGVGIFNFNPKAVYNGQTYELQPLGTEGQGTTNYNDKEKYALTEFCIPMGAGFKKRFGRHIAVGIEAGLRFTFTNYLDDVGGTYADNRVLARSGYVVAAALGDRSAEVTPDRTPFFQEGQKRSHKWMNLNDMYLIGGLSVTYRFTGQGQKCPKF